MDMYMPDGVVETAKQVKPRDWRLLTVVYLTVAPLPKPVAFSISISHHIQMHTMSTDKELATYCISTTSRTRRYRW